jgi:SAM-dependent methyltransferase
MNYQRFNEKGVKYRLFILLTKRTAISYNRYHPMEVHHGHDFYDQQDVFKNYVKYTSWKKNPSQSIEKPIVLSLTGAKLTGAVLDLGCGYGNLAKELLEKGASNYTGVDASRKMVAFAQALLNDERVAFIQADIAQWEYPTAQYDLVVACSVLHYIANVEEVLLRIKDSLKPSGALILSVDHPLRTYFQEFSTPVSHNELEGKGSWSVKDYFQQGPKAEFWLAGKVIKYHRTIEDWWSTLTNAGFRVECLKEGRLTDVAHHHQSIGMGGISLREPQFLIIKAFKQGD